MPLIEVRKEPAAEIREHQAGREHDTDRAPQDESRAALDPIQYRRVPASEPREQHGRRRGPAPPGEQYRRQRRRERERDDERRQDRTGVGEAERTKEGALHAGECDDRGKDQHDDERRIHDARPDFHRRVDHHCRYRSRHRLRHVLAQAPRDVLDVDDGVVHDLAQCDGQAAEGKGVDRISHRAQHDERREQ